MLIKSVQKHFIKAFTLLLFCCSFLIGKGKPLVPVYQNKKLSTISKAVILPTKNAVNLYLKFSLLAASHEAIQQSRKTSNTKFAADLAPQSLARCVKYFNFFSGYNGHRYTLQNADFLFPFHVFW